MKPAPPVTRIFNEIVYSLPIILFSMGSKIKISQNLIEFLVFCRAKPLNSQDQKSKKVKKL